MQFATVSLSALRPDELRLDSGPAHALPTVAGSDVALDESFFDAAGAAAPRPAGIVHDADNDADGGAAAAQPRPLDAGLITLSSLPKLRWQTLLNLETIRVRHPVRERRQKENALTG